MKIIVVTAAQAAKKGIKKDEAQSLLIQVENHNFLYGFSSGKAAMKNLRALGVSSDVIDAAFLPCGVKAEFGGLKPFLYTNFRAVVYARLNAFAPRFKKGAFGWKEISPDESLCKNRRIRRCKNYFLSADNAFVTFSLTDGDRISALPPGHGRHFVRNESGEFLPDDFSHEMYLLVREGKKWTLFCGEARAGLANILRCAKRIVEKNLGGTLGCVAGGFSLDKSRPEIIGETVECLKNEDLHVYTGHSTDEYAFGLLKSALGERVSRYAAGDVIEISHLKK